jgi:polycomb protein EED
MPPRKMKKSRLRKSNFKNSNGKRHIDDSDLNEKLLITEDDDESDSEIANTAEKENHFHTASKENSATTSRQDRNLRDKFKYSLVNYIKEEHSESLYCIQIYAPHEVDPKHIYFATCGINLCHIYRYHSSDNQVELIRCFKDADAEEVFYSLAWTTDTETNLPLISLAGFRGIIKTIRPFAESMKSALVGHGSSINDLRFHPIRASVILSSSKDHTLRLWNINTNVCIAVFGGVEGHRDEVLTGDFNASGTLIMSGSIDHYLKMWNLKSEKLTTAIEMSETFAHRNKSFPTVLVNFPMFATRDVHSNYVDCVRWSNRDFVASKSCEDIVTFWKPGSFDEDIEHLTKSNKNVSIMHTMYLKECLIWFVRFGMDYSEKILALGSQFGKIYMWDLDVDDPAKIKRFILMNPKSKKVIRSIALSMNGKEMFAVNDEGEVFVWSKDPVADS